MGAIWKGGSTGWYVLQLKLLDVSWLFGRMSKKFVEELSPLGQLLHSIAPLHLCAIACPCLRAGPRKGYVVR